MSKKERIVSDYANTAKHYDKRYEAVQFEKFGVLASLDLKGKILDLGGGTGLLGKFLKRKALINIDVSFEMLKQSNELNICADIDHLPLKSGCFDAVLSFTTLQNLPNFSKVFKEVRRVLKGEQFICSVLNKIDVVKLEKEAELAGFEILNKSLCGEDIYLNMAKISGPYCANI
tara:strand:+ start:680 stop:1201 length:522 start_codon:yes stop_codon:yes gene_type:complete